MKQVITLLSLVICVTYILQERDRRIRREVADMLRVAMYARGIRGS
jgi:hypothetical protein